MGENIKIDFEKEYQVQYKKYGTRMYISYLSTIEEAEEVYLEKKEDKNVSHVELIECKILKAFNKV